MEDEIEIDLFGLLSQNIMLLVVATIVGGLLAFGVSMLLPNEYTASTTMYVLSRNDAEDSASLTSQDLSLAQMITTDVTTILKSDRVKADVMNALGLDSLAGYTFNVTNTSNTRVITLSVTGKDPEKAAQIANASVQTVSNVATEVMQLQSVNVIDEATTPTSPSGPRRLLIAGIGALAGLALAIGFVVIRDAADTRIRSGNEAEEIVGVPVVGHFPQVD